MSLIYKKEEKKAKESEIIMEAKNGNSISAQLELNTINDNNLSKAIESSIIIENLYILDSAIPFCCDESENITINTKKENSNKMKNDNILNKMNYKILEFIKIIGNHKNSADFIKELENNFLISGGTDNKLVFYSPQYQVIYNKKFPDWIYNICENKTMNDELEIIASSNKKTYLIKIDEKNYKFKICQEIEGSSLCIEFDNDNFIICYKRGGFHLLNLFSKVISIKREMKISDNIYRGGIQMNDNIFALTSNRVIKSGEDKLILYNTLTRLIKREICGYSFIFSSNGLSLINKNENTTLLCACKKYLKGQKNGILIVNYENGENSQINHFFYDTKHFEVFCFCPILVKNESNNRILVGKMKAIQTDYFLVGGFETKKNKGMIKLYKIIYEKKFIETKIEFIQDIEIQKSKNFKGFKGPVSSIMQSKLNGKVLITCWDGNIYLFKPPNIDYFLFYDCNFP